MCVRSSDGRAFAWFMLDLALGLIGCGELGLIGCGERRFRPWRGGFTLTVLHGLGRLQ